MRRSGRVPRSLLQKPRIVGPALVESPLTNREIWFTTRTTAQRHRRPTVTLFLPARTRRADDWLLAIGHGVTASATLTLGREASVRWTILPTAQIASAPRNEPKPL